MHKLSAIVALAAIWGATSTLPADEPSQEERLTAIVAPFVDGQTLAVAHLDLAKFDAARSINACALTFEWSPATRDRLQVDVAPLTVMTQGLAEGAHVDAFVVVSLADFSRLPFFLVFPIDATTPAAAIAHEARRAIERSWRRPVVIEQVSDRLVMGSPETIARLKTLKPSDRPELSDALRSVGSSAVKIAWIPSADLRRLAQTVLPNLPAQLGGGPTKTFTEGVLWAAIGIDLPPQVVGVHVTLQSTSKEAAASVEGAIATIYDALCKVPENQSVVDFDTHLKRLAPKAHDEQLLLKLTEENQGIAAAAVLLPQLIARLPATRAR